MIKKLLSTMLAALIMTGLLGTLGGCNTMEGFGQDMQQGGRAIKDEAREQKNK